MLKKRTPIRSVQKKVTLKKRIPNPNEAIMRLKVRELVGVEKGKLEKLAEKADSYVANRKRKMGEYVPPRQSWENLKDPVYAGLVKRISQLNDLMKEEYYASFNPHSDRLRLAKEIPGFALRGMGPSPLAKLKLEVENAQKALALIESRKMTQKEYEAWANRLSINLKKFD